MLLSKLTHVAVIVERGRVCRNRLVAIRLSGAAAAAETSSSSSATASPASGGGRLRSSLYLRHCVVECLGGSMCVCDVVW